jgi:hypothetical protein
MERLGAEVLRGSACLGASNGGDVRWAAVGSKARPALTSCEEQETATSVSVAAPARQERSSDSLVIGMRRDPEDRLWSRDYRGMLHQATATRDGQRGQNQ